MSDIYSKFYRSYLKLKTIFKSDNCYKIFKTISKEQWLDPIEIENIQLDRFNKLWNHTLNNSEFYKDRADSHHLPDKIETIKDLASFPLLKRSDLQFHGEKILNKYDNSYYADSSGGSSGIPVHFYHDAYYREFGIALHLIYLSWIGLEEGCKTGILWGADRDFINPTFRQSLSQRFHRYMMLNTFKVSNDTLDKFLMDLEKFNPDYIYGYSSSLLHAANQINATHKYKIHPKAIRSAAEMLYDFQREEIERAFNCPVYNFYGSREVNNVAAECPAHEGLHIFSSGRILEIVDEKGTPLPCGELGYIAITDLTNYAFPFIRYINGDMASMPDRQCSCGRTFPLMDNIAGRIFDILHFNGVAVHGHFFSNLIYQNSNVQQFQVIQESELELLIKLKIPEDKIDVEKLKNDIWDHIGNNVSITVQFVDDIKPLKSGKYRFIINNLKKDNEQLT